MSVLDPVKELRDAGRFAEALRLLGHASVPRDERVTADLIKAELLERTGRHAQSRALAETLSQKAQLSSSEQSTCELVLGRLKLELGDVDGSIGSLQRSINLADVKHDLEHSCWARLRLLLVVADRSGHDAIVPMLSEVRTRVMRAGHPGLMAALHVFVAETEAKRGLLRNARRHVGIGKRTLGGFQNIWLQALAENVDTCIEIMNSDFELALTHAKRCLQLAAEAGAASIHESALGNLGNLAYLAGEFREATDYLNRARSALIPGSDSWNACTETLARICLAQERFSECENLLDEIDDSLTTALDGSRYVNRHTQFTRVQLLACLDRREEALAHAEVVLALATQSGDDLLRDFALLTKADLLQMSDDVEAMNILRRIVSAIPNHSPEFFAHYEGVIACAMARRGSLSVADAHQKRAKSIYQSLGHVSGDLALSRSWSKAVSSRSHAIGTIAAPRLGGGTASIVEDISSMMLHAGRPELIARELVNLLGTTDSVLRATAIAQGADDQTEVLAHVGEVRDHSTTSDQDQRLVIGTARDRRIEVIVTSKDDLESVATVNAVVLLLATLHDLDRARAEREEHATLWPIDELPTDDNSAITVGHMRDMMSQAKKVANANLSILITGESGTGKEVIARTIHAHSTRAQKPFIPFNCAAVPKELLESQLFGHKRGAFTGADRDNPGVIRSARDGTLFLDEIGELGLDLQPKLLRFLESGEICPIGESAPFVVHVRIVAATNANLETLVREGRFREDLFYRLNVLRLPLKPLRERRDEIPTLVNYFVIRAAEESKKHNIRLAEDVMERLVLYHWPGNVRQLQNEIRRMIALAEPNSILRPAAMSAEILEATDAAMLPSSDAAAARELAVPLGEKLNPTLERIEREMIKVALREHQGRVDAAARALGISRKGLYLKRQRLGL